MSGIDAIIEDTTDWTADAPASVNQGDSATEAMEARRNEQNIRRGNQRMHTRQGSRPVHASVGGQEIIIPKERLQFWVQVAQLIVLVLILLRQ